MTIILDPLVPSGALGLKLSQLKTLLMRYGFDEDDPLMEWINAARFDLLSDLGWDFGEGTTNVTSVSGDNSFVVPTGFLNVRSIKDVTDTDSHVSLTYLDRRLFNEQYPNPNALGRPEMYTLLGRSAVTVYPVPNRDTTWQIDYEVQFTELTSDNDYPSEIPAMFHYIIVYKAAAIALMAENEEERASTAEVQYNNGLERMANRLRPRQRGGYETVEEVMGYSG